MKPAVPYHCHKRWDRHQGRWIVDIYDDQNKYGGCHPVLTEAAANAEVRRFTAWAAKHWAELEARRERRRQNGTYWKSRNSEGK